MLKSGLPKLMKTVTLEDIQKQSKTCLVILLDINSMIMEHPPCGFDDVTVKSKRGSSSNGRASNWLKKLKFKP